MIGIYNPPISRFVLEILRFVWCVNDPTYDVTLHNDLFQQVIMQRDVISRIISEIRKTSCKHQYLLVTFQDLLEMISVELNFSLHGHFSNQNLIFVSWREFQKSANHIA